MRSLCLTGVVAKSRRGSTIRCLTNMAAAWEAGIGGRPNKWASDCKVSPGDTHWILDRVG